MRGERAALDMRLTLPIPISKLEHASSPFRGQCSEAAHRRRLVR